MKNKLVLGFMVISMVVVLSSCSKVPQTELDALTVAIEDARTSGADAYLPTEFAALQDSMNSINALVEAQKGKLFANYSAVTAKVAEVTAAAATVKANVETRKVEVKNEIDALSAEVAGLVVQGKALIAKAPKGKEGAAAVAAITTEMGVIETTVGEATALVTEGQLVPALDKFKAAKEKVTAIITELQNAIAKKK